jgi:hypothetical protein
MAWFLVSFVVASAPAVELTASIDGATPRPGWAYVRREQRVVLIAKTTARVSQIDWLKLEPAVGSLNNTAPHFHFEPIPYEATPLPQCKGKLECPADVRPTLLPLTPGLEDVGTMAFQVAVRFTDGTTASSPGMESTVSGGLSARVMRVVVRKDDTLIGFATELFNTPYIFGSAGVDGKNQSDLLIGSDCADLAIYAFRRSGANASYTSSYAIDRQAHPLPQSKEVVSGDVLHFPHSRHVALLYQDNPPLGEVDDGDLILHTCWSPPRVQPLGRAPCTSKPFRVLRFPQNQRANPQRLK